MFALVKVSQDSSDSEDSPDPSEVEFQALADAGAEREQDFDTLSLHLEADARFREADYLDSLAQSNLLKERAKEKVKEKDAGEKKTSPPTGNSSLFRLRTKKTWFHVVLLGACSEFLLWLSLFRTVRESLFCHPFSLEFLCDFKQTLC